MRIPERRIPRFSIASMRIVCIIAGILFIYIWKFPVIRDVLGLIFGAAVVCFFVQPLSAFYERKFSRSASVLFAMLTYAAFLIAALWLLLPRMISEATELTGILKQSAQSLAGWIRDIESWLASSFPGFRISFPAMMTDAIPSLAMETVTFAENLTGFVGRLALMITLAYFLLCDRERILLFLELLIPQSMRCTAVRMGCAVCGELKRYLCGQGLVCALVAVMSAAGLAVIGIRSALVLGLIIGILNMIPYFGPVLGAVPAVLSGLSDGGGCALMAVGILWIIQQIDSMLISPRILSGVTGISPAGVLLAVFIGSGIGGIVGMLLALPAVVAFRTVFRVFVQRYKNV